MSEPSDEQINKRIAEFMGHPDECFCYPCPSCGMGDNLVDFTKSLDALIPVVEKLGWGVELWHRSHGKNCDRNTWVACYKKEHEDKSPARALAMAIFSVLEEQDG